MSSLGFKRAHHMDKASTETSAFFKYPAKRVNAMKYHTSKLHLKAKELIKLHTKQHMKRQIRLRY